MKQKELLSNRLELLSQPGKQPFWKNNSLKDKLPRKKDEERRKNKEEEMIKQGEKNRMTKGDKDKDRKGKKDRNKKKE